MLDFILAAGTTEGQSGSSWIMLVVLGVLMVGMILMSIIPQKKRQKQAQEMMNSLKKGDQIKTIGGFVGVIVGVDNGNNTLDIDMSAHSDGSIIVTIDKSAIYTVMNAVPQQNFDESKTVDTNAGDSVVTADDLEEDNKKKNKKNKNKKNYAPVEEPVNAEEPADEPAMDETSTVELPKDNE